MAPRLSLAMRGEIIENHIAALPLSDCARAHAIEIVASRLNATGWPEYEKVCDALTIAAHAHQLARNINARRTDH
jgi:hypothetical protein